MESMEQVSLHFQQVKEHAGWSGRHGHSSAVFGGRLWVIGGGEDEFQNRIKGDVWSSADGLEWKCECEEAPWPARYLHETLVYRDRIWIFGGMHSYRPRHNLNDVWSSADGVDWRCECENAPWPVRHVFTSQVYDDRMWILGGAPDGTVYYNDVWSSSDGRAWTSSPLVAPRFDVRKNLACVGFQSRLWVIGGGVLVRPGEMKAVNDVWSSSDGAEWRCECEEAPWSPRDLHMVVVYRGAIWLFGGMAGEDHHPIQDVWLSRDGVEWTELALKIPWKPRHCSAPLVFDGRIWFFGGYGDTGRPEDKKLNDVWYGEINPKRCEPVRSRK